MATTEDSDERDKRTHCIYAADVVTGVIVLKARRIHVHALVKTLAHEIAHAMTPGHRHDDVWYAQFMELLPQVWSLIDTKEFGK